MVSVATGCARASFVVSIFCTKSTEVVEIAGRTFVESVARLKGLSYTARDPLGTVVVVLVEVVDCVVEVVAVDGLKAGSSTV